MNKVHYRNPQGKPVCNPTRTWSCSEVPVLVTCPNCKRIVAKSTKS